MNLDLTDLIAVLVVTSFVATLLVNSYKLREENKNNIKKIIQLEIDKDMIANQLDKVWQEHQDKKLEETDGFVRFLSQSRDWAFSYIDDVQKAIQDVKTCIESGYDTEQELNKLFSFLPENKENNE